MSTRNRILVIDDEQIYHDTVRRLLSAERFDVSSSISRVEALNEVERRAPDLIILDIRLSDRADDSSGLDLLKELRRLCPRIQVIVFTGYYLDADMTVKCIKSGAYYVFWKSMFSTEPTRFVDLVTEALNYKPEQDTLEDTYPHPLALLYRDYRRNVVVPQMKFRRLIELAEFLVKLSAIVCLSALKGDRRSAAGRMQTNSLIKPSLGAWFEFLRYAISQPTSDIWIDNMRQIYTNPRRSTVDQLIKLRNEWLGHGVTRPDHEYVKMIERWDGPLTDLMISSNILSVWKFFVVKTTRKVGERYVHTVMNIKGDNPRFLAEQLELPVNCEADKAYIWAAAEEKLLSIDPFLTVLVCDQCDQETVFVYDKLDRDQVLYLDYANGHHTSRVEPYRAVKSMLSPPE